MRVVNDIIEQFDLSLLIEEYSKEGKPSYHPEMMLKVMVYAYMYNTYTNLFISTKKYTTISFQSAYSAQNCQGCPLRGSSFKQWGIGSWKGMGNLLSEMGKIKR